MPPIPRGWMGPRVPKIFGTMYLCPYGSTKSNQTRPGNEEDVFLGSATPLSKGSGATAYLKIFGSPTYTYTV